ALVIGVYSVSVAQTSTRAAPDTVIVRSGQLRLKGLLWRPDGPGPFPAALFNHGNRVPPAVVSQIAQGRIGPAFAAHGWLLLYLFRRGEGLSREQGTSIVDSVAAERAAHGGDAAARLRHVLLTTEELDDVLAGVAYLRGRPDVARDRLAMVG